MKSFEAFKKKIKEINNGCFGYLYGLKSEVVEIQINRYISILERFETFSKKTDPQFFSSPGRTEIGGNHTDHNNGKVLAGAVNLDNVALAAVNNSDTIRIESSGYQPFTVLLSNLSPVSEEKNSSAALVRGIASKLKEFGYNIGGFDAVIDSNVPKGSGLSSSASFEVLIGTIFNHLFNQGKINPVQIAQIGQYAENVYFGKPCGLMDQIACACGGLVNIDFANPLNPEARKIAFDFFKSGFTLIITNTGGSHDNLTQEYAAVFNEMKSVAGFLGVNSLRDSNLEKALEAIPEMRNKTGDRALLRTIHFYNDNKRVEKQVEALEQGDFNSFLALVTESGYSSYMLNQNVYTFNDKHEQSVALGLALSELLLKARGAWRVHGGGFAGTILAFVPENMTDKYINSMENVFGKKSCYNLLIREAGAVKIDF
jgi:galactokinase